MKRKLLNKVDEAFERTWLSGRVMNKDVNQTDIAVLRYMMSESEVYVHMTDHDISCLWKSYISGKLKD
ncbi:MAG: hypothetical protein HQK96_18545 [Nitrospirae bacterium]|nr:hypothetical protein [Nitrospirota bacterium]